MTTPFIPIEEQPHTTAKMFCRSCARVAVHVWPTRTEVQNLECSGCGKVGFLMFHSDVPIRTIRPPGATVTLAAFNALLAERDGLQAQVDALTRAQADKTLLRDWRWQDEALQRIYGMAQDALGIEPPHVIVPDDVADLVERAFNAERATVDALTATLRALEAKWRKEVAGGWRNGVVIAIERCADDLAVLLDERGSR
jgi:hypothetical protein